MKLVSDRLYLITTIGCTMLFVVFLFLCSEFVRADVDDDRFDQDMGEITSICLASNYAYLNVIPEDNRSDDVVKLAKLLTEQAAWWGSFMAAWLEISVPEAHVIAEADYAKLREAYNGNRGWGRDELKSLTITCLDIAHDVINWTTEE